MSIKGTRIYCYQEIADILRTGDDTDEARKLREILPDYVLKNIVPDLNEQGIVRLAEEEISEKLTGQEINNNNFTEVVEDDCLEVEDLEFPGTEEEDFTEVVEDDCPEVEDFEFPGTEEEDFTEVVEDDCLEVEDLEFPGTEEENFTEVVEDDCLEVEDFEFPGTEEGDFTEVEENEVSEDEEGDFSDEPENVIVNPYEELDFNLKRIVVNKVVLHIDDGDKCLIDSSKYINKQVVVLYGEGRRYSLMLKCCPSCKKLIIGSENVPDIQENFEEHGIEYLLIGESSNEENN